MSRVNAAVPAASGIDPVTALQGNNDHHLEQIAQFLECVPADHYCERNGGDDAIGAHVRHLLEHYESLLRDVDSAIDYDRRERDPGPERCPRTAADRIRDARERLRRLAGHPPDGTLPVVCNPASGNSEGRMVLHSSLARELLFLQSHTVHHMALIAVFARQRGLPVPEDFGVAPSTLRHRA